MTKRESQPSIVIAVVIIGLVGLMMYYSGFFSGGVSVTGNVVTSTSGLWQCDDGESETETSSDANIWLGDITRTRTRRSSSAPWSSWTTRIGDSTTRSAQNCYGETLEEGYCTMLDSAIVSVGVHYVTCERGCLTARGTSFCRLPTCTDSDATLSSGGRAATRGTTTGIMPSENLGIRPSQWSRTYYDSCASPTSVNEYSCSNYGYSTWDYTATFTPPNKAVVRGVVSCRVGTSCVDGACVGTPCIPSPEICNGVSDDCDKQIDEGCDDDNDNYCDARITRASPYSCANTTQCCPSGGGDCSDSGAGSFSRNPGATEICGNRIDEDCSGADLACSSVPSAEICDNSDNNANGVTDEGCDDDNDNYCDSAMTRVGTPTTCTAGGGDCLDSGTGAYSVHPGATEVCGNGVDEDCSGADTSCPTPTSPTCTDTDTGNSREVAGVVRSTDPTAATPIGEEVPGTSIAGGLYEYKDSCSGTGTTLYQHTCSGTDVRRYDFACPPRTGPGVYGFCTTDATGVGYCPLCSTNPSAAGCPGS